MLMFCSTNITQTNVLSEGNKENNGRKGCRGCYDKISKNENSKIARNKARRVSTYCVQCEGKPHLCITCFAEEHGFMSTNDQ